MAEALLKRYNKVTKLVSKKLLFHMVWAVLQYIVVKFSFHNMDNARDTWFHGSITLFIFWGLASVNLNKVDSAEPSASRQLYMVKMMFGKIGSNDKYNEVTRRKPIQNYRTFLWELTVIFLIQHKYCAAVIFHCCWPNSVFDKRSSNRCFETPWRLHFTVMLAIHIDVAFPLNLHVKFLEDYKDNLPRS